MKTVDNKKVIDFLGIKIDNMAASEILDRIDECIDRRTPCQVVGVNVDQALRVIEDEYSHQIFDNAEIVFTEGKPIVWMAKWLKRPIGEKISGPDLMLLLCERAAQKNIRFSYSVVLKALRQMPPRNWRKCIQACNVLERIRHLLGLRKILKRCRR